MVLFDIIKNTEIVANLSVIFATVAALLSLSAWRKEFKYKRRIELIEETLALFLEAREIVDFMRFELSSSSEAVDRIKMEDETDEVSKFRDRAYILRKRYDDGHHVFTKLGSIKYRVLVILGDDAAKPFKELNDLVSGVLLSSNRLFLAWPKKREDFHSDDSWNRHLQRIKREEMLFYYQGDDDAVKLKINEIVATVEQIHQREIKRR